MTLLSRSALIKLFQETSTQLGSTCTLSTTNAPLLEYLMGASRKGLSHYAYSMARYKLREKLWQLRHPVRAIRKTPFVDVQDLQEFGVFQRGMVPLLDLAAFPVTKLRRGQVSLDVLQQLGVQHVVLMEDRNPLFFLNYKERREFMIIPLAKQHCSFDQDFIPWMADDLDLLIGAFHSAGIKVLLGFWGHIDDNAYNPFVQAHRNALCPVIPGSDDLNPLSVLDIDGKQVLFPEYVTSQFQKICEDFPFDGLFLGDGMLGYRNFLTPHAVGDYALSIPAWENCIGLISAGVRQGGGELWAFDVMGRTYADAHASGVEYSRIMPYLDRLVVQTYGGVAWNRYMNIPGYTLARDVHAMESIVQHILPGDREKIMATLEIGDGVEGWRVTRRQMQRQLAMMEGVPSGWLGVWSNEWVRRLFV